MANTMCDHAEHETSVPATLRVDIAWTAGGSDTTRYMCDQHATEMQYRSFSWSACDGCGMYRTVTTRPLHFHVVGVKGFHPNNVWERREDGLYDHTGSAYAFTDEEVLACGETHGLM